MNDEAIQRVYQKSADGQWSYPQLFNALRNIGVDRYEVNVPMNEIKYVGGGTSVVHSAPEGFTPYPVGSFFNLEALKKALARVQAKETTYEQFLQEIAAAGVPFYRVDMKPRTVTYHGKNKIDKLVETVPEV